MKAIWIFFAVFAASVKGNIDFQMRLGLTNKPVAIPLSFELKGTQQNIVFLSEVWALKINKIVCDGRELEPSKGGIYADESVTLTSAVSTLSYTYMIPSSGRFIFAKTVNGFDGVDDNIAYFTIPENWDRLVVSYMIRFPDKTVSREYTMEVSRLTVEEVWRLDQEQHKNQLVPIDRKNR